MTKDEEKMHTRLDGDEYKGWRFTVKRITGDIQEYDFEDGDFGEPDYSNFNETIYLAEACKDNQSYECWGHDLYCAIGCLANQIDKEILKSLNDKLKMRGICFETMKFANHSVALYYTDGCGTDAFITCGDVVDGEQRFDIRFSREEFNSDDYGTGNAKREEWHEKSLDVVGVERELNDTDFRK